MDEVKQYRTVEECALDVIDRYGDSLSNRELAEKVREVMKSKTSPACIAWYKTNKIKKGNGQPSEQNTTLYVTSTENNECRSSESEFAYEKDLQAYLSKNLEKLESGLTLYQDTDNPNIIGIEFPVGGRYIDILAKDKEGRFVVIELKVSKGYDKVVGQLLRYIGWIKANLATQGEQVRGIIVARQVTEDLLLAVSCLHSVNVFEYELKIEFKPIKT